MSTIFKYLRDASGKQGKAAELIRNAIADGHHELLTEAATQADTTYPVEKVDGKDVNRDQRNSILSALRTQMIRACKVLERNTLTIKLIDGTYAIREREAAAPQQGATQTQKQQAEVEKAKASLIAEDDEAGQDRLWNAAELVLANLDNAAIMTALREALLKRAATAAGV